MPPADNVSITPGSGVSIAAEQLADGSYVQRMKPTFGSVDTATDVSSTTPLPVTQDGTTELNRIENLVIALRQLVNSLAASAQAPDAWGRTRVTLDNSASAQVLGTVTTVTTVTSLTTVKSAGFSSVPLDLVTLAQANTTAALQRRQIVVS
jgi:hypothetical protein